MNRDDTPGTVYSHRLSYFKKCEKEATFFMASQVMRITLKAYDHKLVDQSAAKIVDTVKRTGAKVSGPVPLPTKKEIVTILRAVHKYKDSRLSRLEMPAGVHIDIKMKTK